MQEINGPLHPADSLEDLERLRGELGPKAGPVFHVDEFVKLKGYRYRIVEISEGGMRLEPHGPTAEEQLQAKVEEAAKLQRRTRGRRRGQK